MFTESWSDGHEDRIQEAIKNWMTRVIEPNSPRLHEIVTDRIREETAGLNQRIEDLTEERRDTAKAHQENARIWQADRSNLTKALEYYAHPDQYTKRVLADGGYVARKALGWKE